MGKIEQMLKEMCPKGVYKATLGELGEFYGGLSGKSKDDFKDGNAKFITYMNVFTHPALMLDVEDKVKIAPGEKQNTIQYGDILFTGSSETPDECGMSSVLTIKTDEKLYLNSFSFGYRFNDLSGIEPNFYKHLFRSDPIRAKIAKTANGVTRFNVSKKLFAKIEVPIPPIEVQREIASVLDSFTELQQNLQDELEARKKQYEAYREKLLTFNELGGGIKRLRLSEIGYMEKGKGIQKSDFMESGVPCIHYGQIHTYYGTSATTTKSFVCKELAKAMAHKGDIVIATTSEDVSACCKAMAWLGDEDVAVSGDAHIFHHNQDPMYIAYLFQTEQFASQKKKAATGTKVVRVSGDAMLKFSFDFPPIEKQREISGSLGAMEAVMSNIRQEIAARNTQYQYYREQLLTI